MGEILWCLRSLYHPRDAIKHFLARPPKLEVVFSLVAVYGFLTLIEQRLAGGTPPALMPLYFVIGWVGSAVGGFLAGHVLGGKATATSSLIAVGITFVVPLIFTPVSIPLSLIAASHPSDNLLSFDLARQILSLVVGIWWIGVCVAAISTAHGLGIARGVVTFFASVITGAVIVIITIILLSTYPIQRHGFLWITERDKPRRTYGYVLSPIFPGYQIAGTEGARTTVGRSICRLLSIHVQSNQAATDERANDAVGVDFHHENAEEGPHPLAPSPTRGRRGIGGSVWTFLSLCCVH